jgi:chromate transport protein ChrA
MKTLLDLYFTFFKMGAVTFGGGYAMLPILQREIVEKRAWATDEDLMDYYAIGQCTPGIIAVNTATFIGQKFAIVDTAALLVFLAVFALSFFTDIPVYLMVIAAGVSGIIIKKAKGDFK